MVFNTLQNQEKNASDAQIVSWLFMQCLFRDGSLRVAEKVAKSFVAKGAIHGIIIIRYPRNNDMDAAPFVIGP